MIMNGLFTLSRSLQRIPVQLWKSFRRDYTDIPPTWDWRKLVNVGVKRQGTEPNCGAYAIATSLEYLYNEPNSSTAIVLDPSKFVPPRMLDVEAKRYITYRDDGYHVDALLNQILKKGFPIVNGPQKVKMAGFAALSPRRKLEPLQLEQFVLNQPVIVCMQANQGFVQFKGKIFRPQDHFVRGAEYCGHAMVVVGYTRKHWIIQNCWGVNWGDEGFFNLQRCQPSKDQYAYGQIYRHAFIPLLDRHFEDQHSYEALKNLPKEYVIRSHADYKHYRSLKGRND